ncbi:MAG: hypothetical protein EOP10_27220 [Proteobacteria bacterium]|nr:MAG: hypothetical protein EOP10_27220 [Pseudomonadota bacterium]
MFNRLWKIFAFLTFSYTLSFEVASAQDYDCYKKEPEAGDYLQVYNLSYNSTLVDSDNKYSTRYLELDGRHIYSFLKDSDVFVYYRGQKLFDDNTEKYVAVDTHLGYRHRRCLSDEWKLIASAFYAAPVNHDLRKYDHSYGHIAAPVDLIWKYYPSLSVNFRATARRYFFQFTDNEGGKTLKEWAFEPAVLLSYEIEDLAFNAAVVDFMGWDFNGEQIYSEYYHEESIEWAATKKWTVSLTHKSDGRIANYAGTGYDITLHDEDRSEIALGISFTE